MFLEGIKTRISSLFTISIVDLYCRYRLSNCAWAWHKILAALVTFVRNNKLTVRPDPQITFLIVSCPHISFLRWWCLITMPIEFLHTFCKRHLQNLCQNQIRTQYVMDTFFFWLFIYKYKMSRVHCINR